MNRRRPRCQSPELETTAVGEGGGGGVGAGIAVGLPNLHGSLRERGRRVLGRAFVFLSLPEDIFISRERQTERERTARGGEERETSVVWFCSFLLFPPAFRGMGGLYENSR